MCRECGCVSDRVVFETDHPHFDFLPNKKNAKYVRRFYLHEILKQWTGDEPPTPRDLLRLLIRAYKKARRGNRRYWRPRDLNKEKIHALCRSISFHPVTPTAPGLKWTKLPTDISLRYKTKRTNRPLEDLRKYGEKWRTIICAITKRKPSRPPSQLIDYICQFFATVEEAFERIRHQPECDGRAKCHRTFGCRYSIPSINYVVKKAILVYFQGNRSHPLYLKYKKDWPVLSSSRRAELKRKYWLPICRHIGGVFKIWLK